MGMEDTEPLKEFAELWHLSEHFKKYSIEKIFSVGIIVF